jgi:hypothetical protein
LSPFFRSQDLLGEAIFTLGNLMTARGQVLSMELTNGKRGESTVCSLNSLETHRENTSCYECAAHRGTVVARGESVRNTRDIFRVQFRSIKLANKDGKGKFAVKAKNA